MAEAFRPIIEIEPVKKSVISKPPIVHEYIIPEHHQIVQPVVHREVVKTELRRIVQPVYEEVTRETQVHEEELSKEVQEKIDNGGANSEMIADFLRSRNEGAEPKVITTYAPPVIKKVMLQPIIYETVIPEIIEEIQPVIHRTIHESHIVKKQAVINETIQQVQEEVVVVAPTVETTTIETTQTTFDTAKVQKELLDIESNIKRESLGQGAL